MSLLEVNGISKAFGGVHAVYDFSLRLEQDDIVGIIGPNGAGKTTAFNLISGVYKVDAGEVLLQGDHLERQEQHAIARSGIARTFQNIRLFEGLNVIENVMAANDLNVKYGLFSALFNLPRKVRAEKASIQRALELLDIVGIADVAIQKTGSLPYGVKRKVEIARALATKPKVLLLDEPAAGMNPSEVLELAEIVRKIRREMKISILLIEHRMEFIMKLCRYIYVLDFGKLIAQGCPAEIQGNETVTKAYIGEEE